MAKKSLASIMRTELNERGQDTVRSSMRAGLTKAQAVNWALRFKDNLK